MFLLTTAVDPRYRLDFFPANLKQKVVRLLKSEVKNQGCCETGQSGKVFLVPPNKPKNDVPKFFCRSILHLNRKQVKKLTRVSNKILLIKRLRQKLLFFG